MSAPSPAPTNPTPKEGWTLDALRIYLEQTGNERDRRYEQRFNDQDRAVQAALVSAEKAVVKAEAASDKRFDVVDEFRTTLTEQAERFITRTEALARADSNAEKIGNLEERFSRLEGQKQGGTDYRVALFGGLAAIATILGIVGWIIK